MKNENTSPDRALSRTHLVLVALVAILAHGMCLKADWYMDDKPHILQSPAVSEGLWNEDKPVRSMRVAPYSLFWTVHKLFGYNPVAFHFLNLSIHVCLSVTFLIVARSYLQRWQTLSNKSGAVQWAALLGCLIFASHPLASEPLNYARCVMIQLATLFSILAGWLTLRLIEKTNWQNAVLLGMAITLASFSKESGFIQAFALILLTLIAFGPLDTKTTLGYVFSRRGLKITLILGASALVFAWFWSETLLIHLQRHSEKYDDHVLTQGRVFWSYIRLMLVPVGLSSDHYVSWSRSFSDLEALLKTLAVLALVAGTVAGLIFKRTRWIAFLVAAIATPLLIRFLYYASEIFVEYRAYPSLPWFGLLLGVGIVRLASWNMPLARILAVILVSCGIALSAMRSTVWIDSEKLLENVLLQYPENNRAKTQLQDIYLQKKDFDGVFKLTKEITESTNRLIEHNAKSPDGRMYDLVNVLEARCLSEQITVYALAAKGHPADALKYAEAMLKHLSAAYPQYYIDPETGTYLEDNPLVMARDHVRAAQPES